MAYCGNMCLTWKDVKNKGSILLRSQVADQAGTSVRLGVFLLLPGWHVSPSLGYPPALNSPVPRDGERHCESEVSSPRIQYNVAGQDSNPYRLLSEVERTNREPTPHQKKNQWKRKHR